MRITLRRVGMVAAATAAAALAPIPAQAAPAPEAVLQLSVNATQVSPDRVVPTVVTVTLECAPDGGTHPSTAAACAALQKADGRISGLSGQEQMCTKDYRPTEATMSGLWRGQSISERIVFNNSCELANSTGVVFAF